MKVPKFKGLVAASYTPMHDDESIAPEMIAPLVDYAVRQKFAGLFAVGSTGEFISLTTEERKTVAESYIREAAGRIPVIVNVGSCSYRESAELAAHAAAAGADALCAIAPFYFRPETVRDLADFIKRIAPACDGRPLYLYHAPGITQVNLPMSEFVKIMLDEVPNFAGIKFTNENLCEFERCVALGGDRIQMMFGRDEMLLGALAMGAKGAIGTTFNYLPRVYQGVIEAFEAGDSAGALEKMRISHRAVAVAARFGISSLKLFMKYAGIDVGPMRTPCNRISPEQEREFVRVVDEIDQPQRTDIVVSVGETRMNEQKVARANLHRAFSGQVQPLAGVDQHNLHKGVAVHLTHRMAAGDHLFDIQRQGVFGQILFQMVGDETCHVRSSSFFYNNPVLPGLQAASSIRNFVALAGCFLSLMSSFFFEKSSIIKVEATDNRFSGKENHEYVGKISDRVDNRPSAGWLDRACGTAAVGGTGVSGNHSDAGGDGFPLTTAAGGVLPAFRRAGTGGRSV